MRCWEGPHAHGVHLEADGQGAAWRGGLPAVLCSQCLLDSLPAGGHSSPTASPILPAPFYQASHSFSLWRGHPTQEGAEMSPEFPGWGHCLVEYASRLGPAVLELTSLLSLRPAA